MIFNDKKPEITDKQAVIFMKAASVFMLIFVAMMFISSFFKEDKTLKLESEIDLQILDIKSERGFLTLQDSIVISAACKLIPEISKMKILESYKLYDTISYHNFRLTLGDITKPYRILKKPFSDTLMVHHYQDTLFFKIHGLTENSFIEKHW